MPSKLSVLLDTSDIVEAHVHGVWSLQTKRLSLIIPATVIEEADFYEDSETTLAEEVGKPRRDRSTLTRRLQAVSQLHRQTD